MRRARCTFTTCAPTSLASWTNQGCGQLHHTIWLWDASATTRVAPKTSIVATRVGTKSNFMYKTKTRHRPQTRTQTARLRRSKFCRRDGDRNNNGGSGPDGQTPSGVWTKGGQQGPQKQGPTHPATIKTVHESGATTTQTDKPPNTYPSTPHGTLRVWLN